MEKPMRSTKKVKNIVLRTDLSFGDKEPSGCLSKSL